MRLAGAAVIDEAEALPLEILEVERLAHVALDDVAVSDAFLFEALLPPLQTLLAGDTQPSARDAVRTSLLGLHRPVEEGDVGAGCRLAVGVEQMISAGVVLVHRLFDEAHAERAREEVEVARRVAGNGCEMVDAGDLHCPLSLVGLDRRCRPEIGRPGSETTNICLRMCNISLARKAGSALGQAGFSGWRPVLLLNPWAAKRLTSAGVDRHVCGWGKASDHAPAWIELTSEPIRSIRRSRSQRRKTN